MSNSYPNCSVLLPGCVLGYLVDSIVAVQYPVYAKRTTWEEVGVSNCLLHKIYDAINGQGIHGAIIFEGDTLVGLFFDGASKHSPYVDPDTYDLSRFFLGMSPQ